MSSISVTDSDHRRNKILEIIIDSYVSTAQPVGSELVARKLRSSLSSATIRNVMVELEQAGYLEQPHTSAGRVPTDQGYRFYVDSVMNVRQLSPEQVRQIEVRIQPKELDVDEVLERASVTLAELAHQAAFAVVPTVKQSTVKQIELLPISARKLLCVLIADEEIVATHVVEISGSMTRDEAIALVRFLNTELVGLPFGMLLETLERRLLAESDSFYYLVKRSWEILQHALATEPTERLFMEGASYIVSQPEFRRDPHKTHELLRWLDAEDALLEHLRHDMEADGVRVHIGHEVGVPGVDECSYLTAPFRLGLTGGSGAVGILGPKRMDYPKMRSMVEAMARCVSELFGRQHAT